MQHINRIPMFFFSNILFFLCIFGPDFASLFYSSYPHEMTIDMLRLLTRHWKMWFRHWNKRLNVCVVVEKIFWFVFITFSSLSLFINIYGRLISHFCIFGLLCIIIYSYLIETDNSDLELLYMKFVSLFVAFKDSGKILWTHGVDLQSLEVMPQYPDIYHLFSLQKCGVFF